jgi:tetratricopeptide (TPR) repeat protein
MVKDADVEFQKAVKLAASPRQSPLSRARVHGLYASHLESIKRYREAEDFYKKALSDNPTDALSMGNFAAMLHKIMKDYDVAESLFQKAVVAHPSHATIVNKYANFMKQVRGNFDKAEELYKQAIGANPEHADSLGNYGVFLHGVRGDHEAAESHYKRAIAVDGTHTNNLGNYALFLAEVRKDLPQAKALYENAIEFDPLHANSLYNYAVLLDTMENDHDAAEAMYQKAIEAAPTHGFALYNYAILKEEVRHDFDGAETLFQRSLKAMPSDPLALCDYGSFLWNRRQNTAEAEVMFRKCLKVDSSYASAQIQLARLLCKKMGGDDDGNDDSTSPSDCKMVAEVEALFTQFLKDHPDDKSGVECYCIFLHRQKQNTESARSYFLAYVERKPGDVQRILEFGDFLCSSLHRNGEADQVYQSAIDLEPSNADVLCVYAEFLAGRGGEDNKRQANVYFQKALAVSPNNPHVLHLKQFFCKVAPLPTHPPHSGGGSKFH